MSRDPIDLYERLPEVYRVRDAERGRPLRALLALISEQAEIVRGDIEGLYDDFFIETCREWVVPYIGDLVGTTPLHDVDGLRRADVARTIYYRRRKGTLAMLEEMAGDVTGWGARAADLFRLLQWSQNLDHVRRTPAAVPGPERDPASDRRVGTVNLRDVDAVDRIDDPFDRVAHTADLRPVESEQGGRRSAGWPTLGRVGFFLWRLESYPMAGVEARASDECEGAYFFDPLGRDAPLFTNPDPDAERAGRSTELGVPRRVRDVALSLETARYVGDDPESGRHASIGRSDAAYHDRLDPDGLCLTGARSLLIEGVEASEVVVADLEDWGVHPEVWSREEGTEREGDREPRVAVDPRRGRFRYRPGHSPRSEDEETGAPPRVTHHYGFSAELGGGPYDRRDTVAEPGDDPSVLYVDVARDEEVRQARGAPEIPTEVESSIAGAMAGWDAATHPILVVTVHDNSTYREPLSVDFSDGGCVVLQAANRRRPHLLPEAPDGGPGAIRVTGSAGADTAGSLVLSGLRVEGGIEIERSVAEGLSSVVLLHSTLVPGRGVAPGGAPDRPGEPGVGLRSDDGPEVDLTTGPSVRVERSIVGPVWLPEAFPRLTVRDSVVDHPLAAGRAPAGGDRNATRGAITGPGGAAGNHGPATRIERSTVLGDCLVRELTLGSESLFVGRVWAERDQTGCVRFSYVGEADRTPERYRCQPDMARAWARGEVPAGGAGVPERFAPPEEMRPAFTALRYGHPGYAQLDRNTPEAIRTGAENGAEMGALAHLKQPQREENLRRRLEEYLPVALDAGLVFVT